jgi:hypothetical protein
MSYQPGHPSRPGHVALQPLGPGVSDEQIDQYLEQLLGGDLPGEGYLNPDPPGENEPRPVPDREVVRDELLRATRVMAIALQLPYSEEKKADLGHALLAAAQAFLLLDPSVDSEGVQQLGPEGAIHQAAEAAAKFPPRVPPNAAEENLNEKTKPQQEALKHDRGQTPRPRPRVGQ